MKAKKFDCVEMMHRGAEEVQNKVRGMTKEEQIAFWRERSRKLTRGKLHPKPRISRRHPVRNRKASLDFRLLDRGRLLPMTSAEENGFHPRDQAWFETQHHRQTDPCD